MEGTVYRTIGRLFGVAYLIQKESDDWDLGAVRELYRGIRRGSLRRSASLLVQSIESDLFRLGKKSGLKFDFFDQLLEQVAPPAAIKALRELPESRSLEEAELAEIDLGEAEIQNTNTGSWIYRPLRAKQTFRAPGTGSGRLRTDSKRRST